MPMNRPPSQRSQKRDSRHRTDLHSHYKILKRNDSGSRNGIILSATAESMLASNETCRCPSPARHLQLGHGTSQQALELPKSPLTSQCWDCSSPDDSARARSIRRLLRAASGTSHDIASEDVVVMDELCQALINHGGSTGQKKADDYLNAYLDPPVTRDSLGELDINSIINNLKLRHDINFDRELHFRPNLDGSRGRAKREAQAQYWSALVAELELYGFLFAGSTPYEASTLEQLRTRCKLRVPRMFAAARDILKALVVESEHVDVDEHLDVTVLMREIQHGVCDLPRIARWVEKILKRHCAPMRDSLIDRMVRCIEKGSEENSPTMLVDGLVQLFAALEAMKLDVANHQIRHMRLALIENTVKFEQQHNRELIVKGRFDTTRSRDWLKPFQSDAADPSTQLDAFLHAFLNLILCPFSPEPFPDTFNLDAERLRNIRFDVCDYLCLDGCEKVFVDIAATKQLVATAKAKADLRSALSSIITLAPLSASWDENLENVTLEITRHITSLLEQGDKHLRGHERQELDDATNEALRALFADQKRAFFWTRGCQIRDHIFPSLAAHVRKFLGLSPVESFTTFMSHNGDASLRQKLVLGVIAPQTLSAESVLADIVRRVTHIAVMHWRVWAPLVYLREGPTVDTALPNDMVRDESRVPTGRVAGTPDTKASSTQELSTPASEVTILDVSTHDTAMLGDK